MSTSSMNVVAHTATSVQRPRSPCPLTTPLILSDLVHHLRGSALARGDGAVQEALLLRVGVLAGEVDVPLLHPLVAGEAGVLPQAPVRVGAVVPRVDRPVVLVCEAGVGGARPREDRIDLAQEPRD